ncbi:hypothetical protein EVAR_13799_1 [Eumeta japonica]|uniref:Uncharacterized protein n=1 Tax=Eumeta variegata TaxID=151549 RepID=A0A4C1U0Y8_EUMVA|nr:hypothetical protein EVAR_13799_1 [Eumeta japonica]
MPPLQRTKSIYSEQHVSGRLKNSKNTQCHIPLLIVSGLSCRLSSRPRRQVTTCTKRAAAESAAALGPRGGAAVEGGAEGRDQFRITTSSPAPVCSGHPHWVSQVHATRAIKLTTGLSFNTNLNKP